MYDKHKCDDEQSTIPVEGVEEVLQLDRRNGPLEDLFLEGRGGARPDRRVDHLLLRLGVALLQESHELGGEEEGEGSGRLGNGRKECDTDDVNTYTRVVGNRAACSKHV